MGSAPEAHDAVSVFREETDLVRRVPITVRAERNKLLRHRDSLGGYGAPTALMTRPRVPQLEQGSLGAMTNPSRLSKPSVVIATCRSGSARAVAMHSEQTAPGWPLRKTTISLRNAPGTALTPANDRSALHRTVKLPGRTIAPPWLAARALRRPKGPGCNRIRRTPGHNRSRRRPLLWTHPRRLGVSRGHEVDQSAPQSSL
jgi:hypothetical protein